MISPTELSILEKRACLSCNCYLWVYLALKGMEGWAMETFSLITANFKNVFVRDRVHVYLCFWGNLDIWFICTFYSPFEQVQDASKCSPERLSMHLQFIQQQNLQKLSAVICPENKHLETLKEWTFLLSYRYSWIRNVGNMNRICLVINHPSIIIIFITYFLRRTLLPSTKWDLFCCLPSCAQYHSIPRATWGIAAVSTPEAM